MGIRAFQPDSGLFEELLIQNQIGHGALGRFRGSEFQNGSGLGSFLRSIFSRVSRFTAPLVRSAMPHVKSALESAKPHLSTVARSAFDEAKLCFTMGRPGRFPEYLVLEWSEFAHCKFFI